MSSDSIEYRPVEGFPGYRVGSDGSVWSCLVNQTNRGGPALIGTVWKQLKPRPLGDKGYLRICFRKEGKTYEFLIHRLACEAFHGPCPEGMETRHWDNNRSNNAATNLLWGTRTDNMGDKVRHGTSPQGSRNAMAKLTDAQVLEIVSLSAAGQTGKAIASRFGISRSIVCNILKGDRWSHLTGITRC
jgi:hypothetical protein